MLLPLLDRGAVHYEGAAVSATVEMTRPRGVTTPRVLLAALGDKMLQLAGSRAGGSVLFLVGERTIASHIRPRLEAAGEGRPAPRIVAILPVCVTDDERGARHALRERYATHGSLPSYRAMLDREVVAGPEDVALVGSEDAVRERLAALAAAGATDFVAQEAGHDRDAELRTDAFVRTLAQERSAGGRDRLEALVGPARPGYCIQDVDRPVSGRGMRSKPVTTIQVRLPVPRTQSPDWHGGRATHSVAGKRVAIVNDGWGSANDLVVVFERMLRDDYGAQDVGHFKANDHGATATHRVSVEAEEAFVAKVVAASDVAITMLGNCGGCTAWTCNTSAELERKGVLSAAVVTGLFKPEAEFILARTNKAPDHPLIVLPDDFEHSDPEALEEAAVLTLRTLFGDPVAVTAGATASPADAGRR